MMGYAKQVSAAATMLMLGGCVSVPRMAPAAPVPQFSAIDFFTGPTEGRASLKIIFSKRHPVIVHGKGVEGADGMLTLDQTVEEAGKAPRQRQWLIRETQPNRYAGTLTDAVGGVIGQTRGNKLTLRFTMKGGYRTKQLLTLAPDGQSAHNVLIVRKFGLTVAVLDETIRKLAP